jgi:hypothetical protein
MGAAGCCGASAALPVGVEEMAARTSVTLDGGAAVLEVMLVMMAPDLDNLLTRTWRMS